MTPIRTVIADDQPMARERLASLLQEEPDVEVVASCASGAEAVRAIEAHRPDLVFLDMQMPELDGFGVIDAVGPARMPSVVFVTAYDELALRAFDVHALDYLLKPFGRQRFQKALERAREHLARERGSELANRLVALVEDVRPIRRASERIVVRSGARVLFVEIHNVDWVEAEGNYVRLHVGEESHLIRETMHAMEQRLGDRFARIHRSRIVNIARVQEMRLVHNGEYEVLLRSGDTVLVD
ncbi:MAG TPA: response regulator, partial [Rhodanobacteraceae bacterium]|nr:response regulator [Rhodanobacteraceae bacterium]